MNIFLNKSIYQEKQLSPQGLAVYVALKRMLIGRNKDDAEIFTCPEILAYSLTGKTSHSRRFINSIRDGLTELNNKSLVSVLREEKRIVLIDCSNLIVEKSVDTFFTIITSEEVRLIFDIENTHNFNLLKYFVYVIGSINTSIMVCLDNTKAHSRKNVVGNLSVKALSDISGFSQSTIFDYNQKLEDFGLLYVYRFNYIATEDDNLTSDRKDGHVKRLKNVYGRVRDKEYINKFAVSQLEYYDKQKLVPVSIEVANDKRKYSQMYKFLTAENCDYSKKEILEIYNFILEENRYYEDLARNTDDSSYYMDIRYTNVFARHFRKYNLKPSKDDHFYNKEMYHKYKLDHFDEYDFEEIKARKEAMSAQKIQSTEPKTEENVKTHDFIKRSDDWVGTYNEEWDYYNENEYEY